MSLNVNGQTTFYHSTKCTQMHMKSSTACNKTYHIINSHNYMSRSTFNYILTLIALNISTFWLKNVCIYVCTKVYMCVFLPSSPKEIYVCLQVILLLECMFIFLIIFLINLSTSNYVVLYPLSYSIVDQQLF